MKDNSKLSPAPQEYPIYQSGTFILSTQLHPEPLLLPIYLQVVGPAVLSIAQVAKTYGAKNIIISDTKSCI